MNTQEEEPHKRKINTYDYMRMAAKFINAAKALFCWNAPKFR